MGVQQTIHATSAATRTRTGIVYEQRMVVGCILYRQTAVRALILLMYQYQIVEPSRQGDGLRGALMWRGGVVAGVGLGS